jgi:predicted DNA-binding protein with PD1-like motif
MRAHAFRLKPGADLKAELEHVARAWPLRAGCIVSCVGSLSRARLRMPGAAGDPEVFTSLVEPMEIVSLTGTLCADGVHLHIARSRADGACIGGHLAHGCLVNTTAELVVGELPDIEFRRRPDPATGYDELDVRPAASGEGG